MNRAANHYLAIRKQYLTALADAAAEIKSLPRMSEDGYAQAIRDIRTKYGVGDLAPQLQRAEDQLALTIVAVRCVTGSNQTV